MQNWMRLAMLSMTTIGLSAFSGLGFPKTTNEEKNIEVLPETVVVAEERSTARMQYDKLSAENSLPMPQFDAFQLAFTGYEKLQAEGRVEKPVLTLVDFSLPSTEKRLWVIDMENGQVLFHSLVSHGQKSGMLYATSFSNRPQSHQSSLGFFRTAETYSGKHGLSLRIDGLERGINHNARARAVVIHAADYVSESFAQKQGRLGRSQGCPALPKELSKPIIETIKEGSLLYIFHPSHKSPSIVSAEEV